VIELLEERVGAAERKRVVHHDLDRFIGSWTAKEAKEFDDALGEIRQIDPELWRTFDACRRSSRIFSPERNPSTLTRRPPPVYG
jgi:hypothetical protein